MAVISIYFNIVCPTPAFNSTDADLTRNGFCMVNCTERSLNLLECRFGSLSLGMYDQSSHTHHSWYPVFSKNTALYGTLCDNLCVVGAVTTTRSYTIVVTCGNSSYSCI